ncbi:MAG TPA: ricin-type beta-trefoil lectin domain protein [Streptosporangiaceae bacterium]|nr:ricin-type beta-trefoil lectin domain protein [Streptosporangiaceae bacterium]
MRSRLITLLVTCATVLGGGTAPALAGSAVAGGGGHQLAGRSPAGVRSPAAVQLPDVPSATPVSWTPNVYAGSSCGTACNPSTIYSTVVVNGEVVVAGAFTQVCTPAPASFAQCPTTAAVTHIFAFNLQTGAIDPNFTPVLDQGPVMALAAGPNNTVYAGGKFTTVNGTSSPGIAQLSVTPGQPTDGQLVPGFSGQANGVVSNLAVSGNALYAGGTFSTVDGSTQHAIARLNATTGALDSSFHITLGTPTQGATLQVQAMSLTPDGHTLAIGGSFQTVSGQAISRLALINTGGALGATATVDNWSAPILTNNCFKQHNYVNAIDFSPDGSFFVAVTTGYKTAGGPAICDTATRFETGATGSNVQPTWVNYTGGDSLHSVVVTGSVVYVGGHNRWTNNECGNNRDCEANAALVNGIEAIDANTGLSLPWWHPGTARGVGVQSLTAFPAGAYPGSDGGLLLGTDVNIIGGASHSELAMFPLTSTTPQTPGGPIPSGMFSDGRLGGSEGVNTGTPAMCADDAHNGSAPGTKVQLSTCVNDAEQNWLVASGGAVQINGLCLDTSGGGTAPGTKVVVNTCTGATSQVWTPGAGYSLVNQASGLCLDDPGASTTSGIQLDIAACSGASSQAWPLPAAQAPPPPPPAGTVSMKSLIQASTQVPCMQDHLNKAKPGAIVEIFTCFEEVQQIWTVQSDQTIRINGLCLDTQGGGTASGTPIILNTCNGGASQQWKPGSTYTLVQQASNLCLTDPGSNTANGTQLQISACSSSATNLKWRLPAV